jgi:N-acetylglucosaminyldiphosphoundecaprenol N-acetyl-beta-D-mannosaminyltransferase
MMRHQNALFSTRSKLARKVLIGDIPIDILTMEETVRLIGQKLREEPLDQIVISGVNAHFVNLARKLPRFRAIMQSNSLNLADGISLVLSSYLFRCKIPERVTGIDLMLELLRLASERGKTVYMLGGREGAAERAASEIAKRLPDLKIVGIDRPPIGKEFDLAVSCAIRERIRAVEPDFLFVCFGIPLQEYWIEEYARDLPVKVVMGNGAAFDVVAGFFRRPPQRIQSLGLEWLYRLVKEPRRLWYRYSIGNLRFILIVLSQLTQSRWKFGSINSSAGLTDASVRSWPIPVVESRADEQTHASGVPISVLSEGDIGSDERNGEAIGIGRAG